LLKSVRRERRCDLSIAGRRRCAGRLESEMEKWKRPGSFRSPGLCVQRFEGAQLRAPLSRMHSVLAPIKLPEGKWLDRRIGRMPGRAAGPQRSHRRRPWQLRCERDQTLHGSVGSDSVARYHDGVLGKIRAHWERVGVRRVGL